jgi:hypothetical protein
MKFTINTTAGTEESVTIETEAAITTIAVKNLEYPLADFEERDEYQGVFYADGTLQTVLDSFNDDELTPVIETSGSFPFEIVLTSDGWYAALWL